MIQLIYDRLHVNIWPDTPAQQEMSGVVLPQIEVWTRRGESQIFNGDEARKFIADLNTAMGESHG